MDHHYEHSMMIYGFDDASKLFQIVGFNKNRNYRSSIASFDDVAKGFYSLKDNKHIPLRLLKYKDRVDYQIDWKKIEYDLQAYIESGSREQMYRVGERLFGIGVVDKAKEGIINEIEGTTVLLDPRPMSLLRDHKLIMLEKIKHFVSLGVPFSDSEIIEKFMKIKDLACVCMNLLLKYEITKDKKVLERLVCMLDDIVFEEKKVYTVVSLAIKKYMQDINWTKPIGFNGD